jgi:hypothetical protein
MQPLRLLATSLLAFPCALTTAAQTPPTSYAPGTVTSTLITVDPQAAPALTTTGPSTFTLSSPGDQPDAPRFGLAPKDRSTALSLPATSTPPLVAHLQAQVPETLQPDPSASFNMLDLPPGTKLSAEQKKSLDKALAGLKKLEKSTQIAANNPPCAKLRVYGFTAQDLESPNPQASTETDCTPVTSAHLKSLQLRAIPSSK